MRPAKPAAAMTTVERVLLTIEQLWAEDGHPPTARQVAASMACSPALVNLAFMKLRDDGRLARTGDGSVGRVMQPRTWPEWRVLARYYIRGGEVMTIDQTIAAPSLLWAQQWSVPPGAVIVQVAGEHTFISETRNSTATAAHH